MTQALKLDLPHAQRPYFDEGVLLFYDGPLIFWLPHPSRRLLAFAVPLQEQQYPCLVVEVTDAQAEAFLSNQLSLQRLCLEANQAWHLPDYGAGELILEPLSAIPADWLPGDVMLKLEEAQ